MPAMHRKKKSSKAAARKAQEPLGPHETVDLISTPRSVASRFNSRRNSPRNSRPGSRYASEAEDEDISLSHLSLDDDDESQYGPFNGGLEEEEMSPQMRAIEANKVSTIGTCIDNLRNRKRIGPIGCVQALRLFLQTLQDNYMGKCVGRFISVIPELLLKSIRRTGKEEQLLALRVLAVATLSCPQKDSAEILDDVFSPLLSLCKEADTEEEVKVAALEALTVVVVFGGGTRASTEELLQFHMRIVATDGESVKSADSASIVIAAMRMWCFVASYMTPADSDYDPEEAGSGGEDWAAEDTFGEGLLSDSQTALETFMEQLSSTETDVQVAASEAIALLFEIGRKYEATTGNHMDLREDPAKLSERLRLLARGLQLDGTGRSMKWTTRQDRRDLREALGSVATSLELGTGPRFSTAVGGASWTSSPNSSGQNSEDEGEDTGRIEDRDPSDLLGYRMRIQVDNQTIVIATWALNVRLNVLRTLLSRGMHTHLVSNPLVIQLVHATGLKVLQMDGEREQKKQSKKELKQKKRDGQERSPRKKHGRKEKRAVEAA